jgi:hypothetical protein
MRSSSGETRAGQIEPGSDENQALAFHRHHHGARPFLIGFLTGPRSPRPARGTRSDEWL